jgi:hypothetical protein
MSSISDSGVPLSTAGRANNMLESRGISPEIALSTIDLRRLDLTANVVMGFDSDHNTLWLRACAEYHDLLTYPLSIEHVAPTTSNVVERPERQGASGIRVRL